MARPRIRHIAIFARNPTTVAEFYKTALEMEQIGAERGGYFLSDGYLTLAILPHRLEGSAPVGINHFGFSDIDPAVVFPRITELGLEEPKRRPSNVPYAEFRGADPEGNWFDLTETDFGGENSRRDQKEKQVA